MFLVGDTYTTLLSGAQTGGAFTLLEALVLPEAGRPPHAHHGEEETFVLLEGEMSFHPGGETYDARPGTVLYVPRDVPPASTQPIWRRWPVLRQSTDSRS